MRPDGHERLAVKFAMVALAASALAGCASSRASEQSADTSSRSTPDTTATASDSASVPLRTSGESSDDSTSPSPGTGDRVAPGDAPLASSSESSCGPWQVEEIAAGTSGTVTSLRGSDFAPDRLGREAWCIAQGDDLGATFVRERTARQSHGATFAELWSDETTLLLRTEADGSIVMPATISHRERVISLFDPPLMMMPTELRLGETVTTNSRMQVVDERNPARVQHEGRATRRITLEGSSRMTSPRGTLDVLRISVEFTADLPLAKASENAVQYVLVGEGLVAEERTKEIRAVGIFSRRTVQTRVRLAD